MSNNLGGIQAVNSHPIAEEHALVNACPWLSQPRHKSSEPCQRCAECEQVLLNKLELYHRATKRDCLQGLAALLVNSLPNITRFTEVSGVAKVSA